MPFQSPTFILSPGRWHTTAHLQPLLTALHKRNQNAHAIQLASIGLQSPRPTFANDVHIIYTAVSEQLVQGKDVCLVLHSYGGMPGAEAINRLIAEGALESQQEQGRGRLVRVVFISAYTFPAGFIFDARDFVSAENPAFSVDAEGMHHMANPAQMVYNDLSPAADAQPWINALDHTYYHGRNAIISSENWRKAPVTALLCKKDNSIPPEVQEEMWQGVQSEWIDAGHVPFVSQPEKVAEILVRLASGE